MRGTIPLRNVLYKNGLEIASDEKNDLPTITVLNGPVQAGFTGELVSMMMTFQNYELETSTFKFNYDGKCAIINFKNEISEDEIHSTLVSMIREI